VILKVITFAARQIEVMFGLVGHEDDVFPLSLTSEKGMAKLCRLSFRMSSGEKRSSLRALSMVTMKAGPK